MFEWLDVLHVLSEIVLVLIVVRLQYELFCVNNTILDFLKYVDDLNRMGILSSKPSFGTGSGNRTSDIENPKEKR